MPVAWKTLGAGDRVSIAKAVLKGDDDAAARDAEDDCVGAIGELGQVGGELASGVFAVFEDHGVTRALSLRGGPFREWFRDGYSFLVYEKVLKSSQQGC